MNPVQYAGSWLRHLVTRDGGKLNNDSEAPVGMWTPAEIEGDPEKANIFTSRFKGEGIETHALLLDLDVEHVYFPSTTPGHGHLAVNVKLSQSDWAVAMRMLSKLGLIEPGYASASVGRGYSALRLPWIKKEGSK